MPDDLLSIDQALSLVDLDREGLLRAIERGGLPRVVVASRSPGDRLRVRRQDLERFAGSRWLGHAGDSERGADPCGGDVLSTCLERGCDRYAPGPGNCKRHGGTAEPLRRALSEAERLSYHEAGHAVAVKAVGWKLLEISIPAGVRTRVGFGRGEAKNLFDSPPIDSPNELRHLLVVSLAGPIAAQMARREDWRQLPLDHVRQVEE